MPEPTFAGRTVVISGASGIAAATAVLAAGAGARVFIISLVEDECVSLVDRIRGEGGRAGYAAADLTDARAAGRAVHACLESCDRIDALFNVAGISGRRFGDGPLHECTEEGWDVTLDVNLKSMFLLTRRVLNQMLSQAPGPAGLRGTILNMGSVTAFHPQRDYFATHAYAAAKGAIVSMTKGMAAYYMVHKIRVNVIAPGLVTTPTSRRAQSDDEIMRFMREKQQPLSNGILDAGDVARAALFLLSDESRHITGQVVTIDGGWSVS